MIVTYIADIFQASTTIAILVRKRARVIPIASSMEAATYLGADYRIKEHGSAELAGFDFGNSPTEVEDSEIIPGVTVVLPRTAPGR